MRTIHLDEATRRIQHAGSLVHASSCNQSRMHPARPHPAHTFNSHRSRISASGECRTAPDGLERAEAFCDIEPADTVGEEPAAGVFQHYIQLRIVNGSGSKAAI